MTAEDFRKLALALQGTEEKAHQGHPDFRVAGKIFASLGYPDSGWAMVKLTPELQLGYIQADRTVFEPASGAWGRAGSTMVRLASANPATVEEALQEAWRGTAAKPKKKGR